MRNGWLVYGVAIKWFWKLSALVQWSTELFVSTRESKWSTTLVRLMARGEQVLAGLFFVFPGES